MNYWVCVLIGFSLIILSCSQFSKTENEIAKSLEEHYSAEIILSKGLSVNDSIGEFYNVEVKFQDQPQNPLLPSLIAVDFYSLFEKRGLSGPDMLEIEVGESDDNTSFSCEFMKIDVIAFKKIMPVSSSDISFIKDANYYSLFEKYNSNNIGEEDVFVNQLQGVDITYGGIKEIQFTGWTAMDRNRFELYFNTNRAKLESILVLKYLIIEEKITLTGFELK